MGSSETEANALAVIPWISSSRSRVMMVTPVAKHPIALRKSAEFKLIVEEVGCREDYARRPHRNRLHYHAIPLYDSRQWPFSPSRRPRWKAAIDAHLLSPWRAQVCLSLARPLWS